MTIYTGKDIYLFYDIAGGGDVELQLVQEMSMDLANGEVGNKQLGLDTIKEFAYKGIAVSGSMKVIPQSSGDYSVQNWWNLVLPSNALPVTPTKDVSIKIGDNTSPDWTILLTKVSFGSAALTFNEDPFGMDIPFTAITAGIS